MKCWVVTLVLDKRTEDAPELQDVLTRHGCLFKVRLGVHAGSAGECSDSGLIILLAEGDEKELDSFFEELKKFPRVKVKCIELC
ncbi:MAG: hypothetical protein M1571_10005 [Firmicutes bacterium]|nr:hypothetical protein [Bacillota bacterium]